MWLAILLTVISSTSSSVGKALQKEATRGLPRFSLDARVLREYRACRGWVAGVAADLGGGALQAAAFALAPVSVLQPVSGVGLVGLALYSHFFARERLARWEWAAVGAAGAGTALLGASSGGAPPAGAAEAAPSAARVLFVLALVATAIGSLNSVRARAREKRPRAGAPAGAAAAAGGGAGDKAAAALFGLQAGGCFGLSASACRAGFVAARAAALAAPAGIAASLALSSAGFVLQTLGLKEGSAVVVCTCAAVSSMVTGVFVGLAALGERMPGAAGAVAARLLGWHLILGGVTALAAGRPALEAAAAAALARLPQRAWALLPLAAAVRLKAWAGAAAAGAGLPDAAPPPAGTGAAAGK
jgi:hypothetical protein